MYRLISAALAILLITACEKNAKKIEIINGSPKIIDVLHSANIEVKALESEIGTATLLQFQGKDTSFFLASIKKIIVFKSDFFILDDRFSNLSRFDPSGNLLTSYGTVGLGPNDFSKITDFDIDTENNRVVVMSTENTSMYYYDLSGKFIRRQSTGLFGTSFSTISGGQDIFYRNFSAGKKSKGYNIAVTDSFGNQRGKAFSYDPKLADVAWESTGFLRKENGRIFFAQAYSDTVYEFSNNTFTPAFDLKLLSPNLRPVRNLHRTILSEKLLMDTNTSYLCSQFFVNVNYAVFNYQSQKRIHTSILDFKSGQIKTISPQSQHDPLIAFFLTPLYLDMKDNLYCKFELKEVIALKKKNPDLYNQLPERFKSILNDQKQNSGAFILKIQLNHELLK